MARDQHITRQLAEAQEHASTLAHAPDGAKPRVLYSLYTENFPNLPDLVKRYFAGATIYDGLGIWDGGEEQSAVIEILGTDEDLQSIAFLAVDIKVANRQQSVIITWTRVSALTV